MGVNDLVVEDNNLIQHIKTSLLEFGKPDCSEKSADLRGADYDKDGVCANTTNVDHETLDRADFASLYPTTEEIEFNREMVNELVPEEFNMASPDDCSKGCCGNQQPEDSLMLDGNNTALDSPVQSFRLIDEEDNDTDEDELLSLCIQDSFISDGCISQAFASQERTVSSPPQAEIVNNLYEEIQDCNDTRFSSLELGNDEDLHYKRTVAVVLKTSGSLVKDQSASISSHKSSFIEWKEEGRVGSFRRRSPQNILRKIFSVVPKMHGTCPVIPKDNGNEASPQRPEANKTSVMQNSTEKRRESQKYSVLRSLVPSRSEEDKTSILNSTIDYLKELEARVEELESCINQAESESRTRRKYPDIVEQTSDNCDDKRGADAKKPSINKRKASDIDENDPEFSKVLLPGNLRDLKVSITDKEVLIEMRCHSREYILLDVMEALSNLTLDTHTVQSSTLDGILSLTLKSLTLKSQFRGAAVASVGMIKQKLRRTIGIC
uniref:Putative MYC protein n=1 Tax=Tamarix hispida TaxID=189793 RepID=G1FCI2_9CARY|nr:putative MYC protein [Tamarix hispida]